MGKLFELMGEIVVKNDKANTAIDETTGKAKNMATGLGDKFTNVGKTITGIGTKLAPVSAVIGAFGLKSIQTGADFEAGMSKVQAISGASGEQLVLLTDKAREMGAKTKFSATESAEAMQYMAMAGWKTSDMLDGLEGVMNLATASGESLGTTSDIVTDALTAFGLSAKDSGHFADILATASTNSNTNVSLMGETFKYVAPIAGALGYSAEDTAVSIGLMANSGIKGSQAGTSLRTIMSSLTGDITIAGQAMGEMTIATTNADGTMRPFSDIIGDCRIAFQGLSAEEKVNTAQSLVGKNAMSGFLALMNAGEGDVNALTSAIENCDGNAKTMADTMNNNLNGQLTILKSSVEELMISFANALLPTIKNVVTFVQNLTTKFNSLDEKQKQVIATIGAVIAVASPLLITVGKVVTGVGSFITTAGKAVNAIKLVTSSSGLMGTALSFLTNPITLVVGAIVGLVAYIVHLWQTNEEFRQNVTVIWNAVKETISEAIEKAKTAITTAYNAIKTALSTVGTAIKTTVTTTWNSIKTGISTTISSIKTNITTTWTSIKTSVTTTLTGLKTSITTGFTSIKTSISTAMTSVKTTMTTAWNAVKTTVTTAITSVKTSITTGMTSVKTSISTSLSSVKTNFSTAWSSIKTNISTTIGSIKTAISTGLGTVLSTVTSKMTSVKEKFSTAITGAKTAISNGISAIKGIFSGANFTFPSIKLPHFTISGSFGINPPSVPHFGISWYRKAMEQPYMFTSPTLFDVNPVTGQAKGAGEAGDELMYGKQNLLDDISGVVASQNNTIVDVLNDWFSRLFDIMEEYFPEFAKPITIDRRRLATELAEPMNEALGQIYRRRG